MVASQSHVLHWQRCRAAAATAPGATGGHGVGSHVADAENSGAPPSPLPSPVATSALNEGLVGGQPLPLFGAFLFRSSDGNPLLSLLFSFSSSGLDRFLSPSSPVYLFSRGRRPASGVGRDGANIDGRGHDRQSWLLFKAAMHYGHMHPLHAQSIFVQLDCLSLRNMSGCKGCVVGGFFL